jgi:hypothetical protein
MNNGMFVSEYVPLERTVCVDVGPVQVKGRLSGSTVLRSAHVLAIAARCCSS